MARVCDVCGKPVGDDDLFCINCGARLTPREESVPTVPPMRPTPTPTSTPTPTPTPSPTPWQGQGRATAAPSLYASSSQLSGGATASVSGLRQPAVDRVDGSRPGERVGGLGQRLGAGGLDDPDAETMVFDDEDPDAPTFVFQQEPVYVLVRTSTGEELVVGDGDVLGKGTKASARVSGNHGISRQHLIFRVRDGRCLIEDNDSTNGTFVDGERLEPHVPREVEDGTVVRVADEDFEFQVR